MKRTWTEEKDALLRRLYPDAHLGSLAFRLGVSVCAMKSRAKILGLRRIVNQRKPWTDEQLRYLTAHYADTPIDELVRQTSHNRSCVYAKSRKLGLCKSPEFISDFGRTVSQSPASIASRFKKGVPAANKGKRIHEFMSPEGIARSSVTRFRKGHRPHNSKPVGYERVRRIGGKDDYIFIKVAEGQPMVLKHRWLWEQFHGPIPADCCVVFRDGNAMHCTLDNIELITRAENARRRIAKETPEKRRRRMTKVNEALAVLRRRDKARIHFGLEPKTKLVKRW